MAAYLWSRGFRGGRSSSCGVREIPASVGGRALPGERPGEKSGDAASDYRLCGPSEEVLDHVRLVLLTRGVARTSTRERLSPQAKR